MSKNPNRWLPMMVPMPSGKQVEVKATGQKGEVYDQATMESNDVPFVGPHGFRWTHWRLTENNEKKQQRKCPVCQGTNIFELNEHSEMCNNCQQVLQKQ